MVRTMSTPAETEFDCEEPTDFLDDELIASQKAADEERKRHKCIVCQTKIDEHVRWCLGAYGNWDY